MKSLIAGVVLLASFPVTAWAQAFQPSRPVEIIVHNAPGGGSDLLARFISTLLEKEKLLPVRTQVNNRPGGGSALAMAYMAEKRGDPHTIALFTSAWMMTPILSAEAKAGFYDMTPIARLVLESSLVVVKADSPYRTLQDFIEAAKKEPGKLKQSGGSVQTRGNFVRLILQRSTGARWSYISFPGGGERIAALLGGHVEILMAEPQELGEYIRNGQLRAVAQITEKRLARFPDVPTLREAGFNVHSDPTIRGAVAPPRTAKHVVAYWEEVFARMVKTEGWRKYLEDNQFEDGFQRGDELLKSSKEFVARMREMLKDAGLKVYR
ncbi:MAG: tripartite tricarboxylate transporter substrate binding protein [Betaproteobacteria bacterium]|nr:tripartite tricarboxylate transporter substrate binding protein [Betaproteobacteria bacterium]